MLNLSINLHSTKRSKGNKAINKLINRNTSKSLNKQFNSELTKLNLSITRAETHLNIIQNKLQEAKQNNNIYFIRHFEKLLTQAMEDLNKCRVEKETFISNSIFINTLIATSSTLII